MSGDDDRADLPRPLGSLLVAVAPLGPGEPDIGHVIILSGEVDLSREPELDHLLERFLRTSTSVVDVDLTDVSFLDSTGLTFLVRLRNGCLKRNGRVRLGSPQPFVSHTLRIAGLTTAFDYFDAQSPT